MGLPQDPRNVVDQATLGNVVALLFVASAGGTGDRATVFEGAMPGEGGISAIPIAF